MRGVCVNGKKAFWHHVVPDGKHGYLILGLYLSMNRFEYNGMTGTYAALLGNELLVPYIIFCVIGIMGFVICVYETYFRKKK